MTRRFLLLAAIFLSMTARGQDSTQMLREYFAGTERFFQKRGLDLSTYDYTQAKVNENLRSVIRHNRQAQVRGVAGATLVIVGVLTVIGTAATASLGNIIVNTISQSSGSSCNCGGAYAFGAAAGIGGLVLMAGASSAGRKRDARIAQANALLMQ